MLLKNDGTVLGTIAEGLLAYVGVMQGDGEEDSAWMANKLSGLRIFSDTEDKMNLSVLDINGGVLLVSQFTLSGDVRKGRRPSFNSSEAPEVAEGLLTALEGALTDIGLAVEAGRFGAGMIVQSDVDGPVTILLDSKKAF